MLNLLTLNEVAERARRFDVAVPPRTLWEYLRSNLLPQGKKISGQGNVLYYPEYAPDRLVQVYWLNKKLGIPISVLQESSYFVEGERWEVTNVSRHPSPLDVIVTCAGLMARMGIVHKTKLRDEDLAALFEHLKTRFERWRVDL
jgi:hypothetical protein